jgi:transcriptional regulator with XRE-family HTH domain
MKDDIETFPALVRWIAEQHHGGVIYQLAQRVGISPALADRWSKGLVQHPTMDSVMKFCRAYGLDLAEVLRLRGGPLPPEAIKLLAPLPRRKKLRPIGGGSSMDGTLPLPALEDVLPLIGRLLRWLWGPSPAWRPCAA